MEAFSMVQIKNYQDTLDQLGEARLCNAQKQLLKKIPKGLTIIYTKHKTYTRI